MPAKPSRLEVQLLLACILAVALALLAPELRQPADQHDFADRRALWGIPNAADVLSNLGFALVGLLGLRVLARGPAAPAAATRAAAAVVFVGCLLTAAGSAWYHLQPGDAGLAIDRLAMAITFAGILGLAAAGHVGGRAAAVLCTAALVLAPLAVFAWARTGNVLPWVVVQFGGMVLIAWFALLEPRPDAPRVRWFAVLGVYAVAKAFELADHAVFAFTQGIVSGHTLKHVVAACALLPIPCGLGRHLEGQGRLRPRVPGPA